MEQLNRAHDNESFVVVSLEHAASWKECHVEFCKAGFGSLAQLNILSGSALIDGRLNRSKSNSLGLYFPGFQPLAMKLLFHHKGTACDIAAVQDQRHAMLQQILVRPLHNVLPIGLSIHLRPKSSGELTGGELLAKEYFIKSLAPAIGKLYDESAAHLEALICNMNPGEERVVETGIPAIFDGRHGSQVLRASVMGFARSVSAPRLVKLWQAPPGQVAEVKHILMKSGDNPHHDRFALAMARVFNHLWQREGVAVSVGGRPELVQNVLYGILQAGVRTSVIEMVSGSTPVRSFHDRHSRLMFAMFGDSWWQGDLNDWVPSAPLIASAAAAFTTAFILDIGDRHQDNMLVTRSGHLFNIDFSFIFGEHPRFVDAQPFAIPVALRTALVQSGPLWGIFKGACVRAFAALVKHREFVVLQAIETARALGSHFLITHALTFGKILAEPGLQVVQKVLARGPDMLPGCLFNSLDMYADEALDSYVEVVGSELSRKIERGVYGHQAKDIIHEKRCTIM
jgi:hypothetical protein